MAVTVPVLDPNSVGHRWLRYEGGAGTEDNEVLIDVPCDGAIEVIAHSVLGTWDVFGSVDGTTFSAVALALEDMHSVAPATRVVVSTADRFFRITQPGFKTLRFQLATTTDVTSFSVAVRVK